VKTTWHIPKPMASLSRSLAPGSKPAPRPETPAVDDNAPARAVTVPPPPMRRHAQAVLGVVASRLPLFVWSTDSALRVTSCLGTRPESLMLPELQGPKPELRLSDRLRPSEAEPPTVTAHRRALRGEVVAFDVQDKGRIFEVHIEPLRDVGGAVEGTVGVACDVTERRGSGSPLAHATLNDPLTGLPNRTVFLERLRQSLGRARRSGTARVAVLLVDLDDFKSVNHQLGHDAGDRLLVDVSRRIEERLRAADTLARLEGDTFAVLLQDVERDADAVQVARRIREDLARPFAVSGWPRPAAASVGIAISQDSRTRIEDLLHDAETALRRARGGAGVHVFDPAIDLDASVAWPRLAAADPALAGVDRRAAADAVLPWRPAAGTGTSRLRRLARAAGLILPSRF
jgi:diguanylate cyclase (GGDEF)-like protein